MKLFFLTISLCFSFSAFNQTISLVLRDKITNRPIGFARVMIKSLIETSEKSLLSGENGEIETTVKLPVYTVISCIGYKICTDTIKTFGRHEIFLSPEYYQLDNVVVTGQFRPQIADKSIYKIDIIDSRQIKFKTSNNLDELLKNELSFAYRNEGTIGDNLRIRGLSGEYVKVLIDGMPVTGREYDFIDLSQIGLYNVDHIEVIEGPMSVVYGSNALAGAINIITSNYSNYNMITHVNANYETVGIYNFDALFGRRFRNNFLTINFARNFYSAWNPYDTSRVQSIKPKLQYITGLTYNYAKNRFKISYTGSYINEELRDIGALGYDGKALDSYYYFIRQNNSLSLSNDYSDNFVVNFQAGYSYYHKRIITYVNDLVNLDKSVAPNPDLQDTSTFNLISSRGVISNIPGKKFEYQTGFETTYESVQDKRIKGSPDIFDFAYFLSIIYHPLPLISLQPGVRYIYNSKFKAPLVYAINLKYNPGSFIFRASYAKGFNAPSLKQM
jgi:outer membrane receptor for ferrienterochelin and colicins